jgi:cytochrome b6-f complex iron-sulfur subunit
MTRDEFLSTFGVGIAAVCAGGCLAACGKKSETADLMPVPPTNVNFTINLNTEITAVGQSKTSSGVIVVRVASGNVPASFTAVQVACSHEGTSIEYNVNQGKFICPNHGSNFTNAGVVSLGPATVNLKKYTVAVSGTTLTVTD